MQKKIGELLWDDWKDGITETEVPLTFLGIDIKNNGLMVGFEELRPQYIEAIRKIVRKEISIDFSIIGSMVLNTSRSDIHRPVFGGIQIMCRDALSTLSFRATLLNGTQGFVMTGHAGWVGSIVFQPYSTWGGLGNRVGRISVNPERARYSDSAFVTATVGVEPIFIEVLPEP